MTGTNDPRNEQEMISAILAGDTQLFHALIRPYERRVFAMAVALLHNDADAEEVAQEAFLRAFRKLESFRGDASFSTWLISITLNEARSRMRRKTLVPMESLDGTTDEPANISPALLRDWKEIPSQALERREVRLVLQEAIATLPTIYREVFLLRDVEELSIKEAAEVLQISIASIKVRLHRARIMLQKELAPKLKAMSPKRRWGQWF